MSLIKIHGICLIDAFSVVRTCKDGSPCGLHGDCLEMGYNTNEDFDHFICKCHLGFKGEFCQKSKSLFYSTRMYLFYFSNKNNIYIKKVRK